MKLTKIKSVEDYLNNVSYDHTGYVPKEASLSFMNFIKLINGSNNNLDKSPVTHYKLMDNVFSKKSRLAILCHRGFAKSTILTTYLPFYIAVYGKLDNFGVINYILAVMDSQEGGAKALSLDSKVITKHGYISIDQVQVGQELFGSDGKLHKVTSVSKYFDKPMMKLCTSDGRVVKCSEDHLWTVYHNDYLHQGKEALTITTKELYEKYVQFTKPKGKNTKGHKYKYSIKLNDPVEFKYKSLKLDPYTLGVLLGDGSCTGEVVKVTCQLDQLTHYKENIPYKFGYISIDKRSSQTITFNIKGIIGIIKDLGINVTCKNKRIPQDYMTSSIDQRLALLQGLMDTDGISREASKAEQVFCSTSKQLATQVQEIIFSLGGTGSILIKDATYYDKCGKSYNVSFSLPKCPFRLKYKADNYLSQQRNFVTITGIHKITQEKSKCISIDTKDHLFLTNSYLTTHNTMRRSLELTYENSPFLQTYIKDTRFTDAFIELENIEGHRLGIKLVGAQMSIRGTRFNNKTGSHRPELAIMDDILSDVDAKSPTVISNIENTIHKAVDKALEPAINKIIYIGTVFNTNDPLYKVIGSGRWSPSVFPVCEKFPCTREEFRGSWEERFSYDVVDRMYKDSVSLGRLSDFNGEMMNRIMSDEDRLIQDSDIVWYKRDTLLKNKGIFNFYITTDFATSEKTSADYSVITVWAYNSNGDWLLVDGVCRRQLMDKNIDDLFKFSQMYKPQQVGIEVTGQQGGFIQWIKNEMLVRNCYFTLASDNNGSIEGIRPNTNKLVRFNTMIPLFKTKKIMFPEELKTEPLLVEAIEELKLVSVSAMKSRHDDVLDCISMLSSLTPWKPSTESELIKSPSNSIWEIEDEDEDSPILDSYII